MCKQLETQIEKAFVIDAGGEDLQIDHFENSFPYMYMKVYDDSCVDGWLIYTDI